MKATIRRALLGAGLATVTVAVIGATALTAPDGRPRDKLNVSYHEKPQTRVVTGDDWQGTGAWIEETQMIDPPQWGHRAFGGPPRRGMPPFGLGTPHGPMARAPFGLPLLPILPPSPRAACDGEIDQLMAYVGYLRSKMRLQGDQKAAWLKVEQTAEPNLEKLRDLCAELPSQSIQPPAALEALDFAEKQMAARLDLLRAVRGPVQELYDILSPDQRTLLAPRHPSAPQLPDDDNL